MQHGLFNKQNWCYPESRVGDIGIHRSNYYFAPSCRFENPAAHYLKTLPMRNAGLFDGVYTYIRSKNPESA
ncbi:MAG: hypothetical protein SGI87_11850 [Flavobacteriales bacterium]|nr:hypothetical protein [Flavobacteriales bacterium]